MKMGNESFPPERRSLVIQAKSSVQLPDKVHSNIQPVLFPWRLLVRIEQTIILSSRLEDKMPHRKVFYRTIPLTHQGKLDKEKLLHEILSRQW